MIVKILLAVDADVLRRLISLVDSLLGDRFTNHVDLRLARVVLHRAYLRRALKGALSVGDLTLAIGNSRAQHHELIPKCIVLLPLERWLS
jgi:hypothetical protein